MAAVAQRWLVRRESVGYFAGELVRDDRGIDTRVACLAPHGNSGMHYFFLQQFLVALPAVGCRGECGAGKKKDQKGYA